MRLFLKLHLIPSIFIISMGMMRLQAQPPGGPGGPGRMDIGDMVEREKQTLYKSLDDLSDDQKLLLDGIYEEFVLTMKQNMEEMRNNRGSGDPESMREKMDTLLEEKNGLIKDVLNSEQYAVYLEQMERSFGARRRRRGQEPPAMPDDTTSGDND